MAATGEGHTDDNQEQFNEFNISDITRQIIEHAPNNEQDTTEFFVPKITIEDEDTGDQKTLLQSNLLSSKSLNLLKLQRWRALGLWWC